MDNAFAFDNSDTAGAADAAGLAAALGFPGAATTAGGVALGTGSGQAGVVPVANGGGGNLGGYVASLKSWLAAPLSGSLSPSGVFLLVGVVLVAIVAWNLVLYHIRIAAEVL